MRPLTPIVKNAGSDKQAQSNVSPCKRARNHQLFCVSLAIGFVTLGLANLVSAFPGGSESPIPASPEIIWNGSVSPPGESSPVQYLEQKYTKEMYDRLRTGMTYEDTVAVMGDKGKTTFQSSTPGSQITIVTWGNPNGSFVTVGFQNNQLLSKNQTGLK